jgi:hypothetical protein
MSTPKTDAATLDPQEVVSGIFKNWLEMMLPTGEYEEAEEDMYYKAFIEGYIAGIDRGLEMRDAAEIEPEYGLAAWD